MFPLLGGSIQAEDVVGGGVVEEIGLGRGDVVAELPMSDCCASVPWL